MFGKDWKTTLAGLAAGGLNLFANGTNPKQIALSLGVAVLGHMASDAATASLQAPPPVDKK
jgi:hypothetical protein